MKTLKILLTSALFASVAITGTVQADNSLSNLIYEESSNIYSQVDLQTSTQEGILSYSDDANSKAVWSTEFEQYVNPADFQQDIASTDDVNQYMDSNPTAAGRTKGREVFIYNETVGEYHLQ
ncbi:MAG: hypothetical protein OQL19_19345 [Gammaproteobacteria bacterium]|nr:hypothetical protein [Gammaproteobacteria bacterium]